jgi:hypothetical protein
MKPRYEPAYPPGEYPNERFVGYIEEFDMYIDADKHADFPIALVSGERGDRGPLHDIFSLDGNELIRDDSPELNITPYHMCLIYAKAIEHGLIKDAPNET